MAKMLAIALSAFAAVPLIAGTAVPDPSDSTKLVITAGAGESYTNSIDFSGYGKLDKRGDGEAVLNAACTFAGSEAYVAYGKLKIDGAAISSASTTLKLAGGGRELWHLGDMAISTLLTVQGTTAYGGGDVYFTGENSCRDIKQLNVIGSSMVTHEAGETCLRWLCVGNGGDSAAHFRQTGGVVNLPASETYLGLAGGQRSCLTMEGGEFIASNKFTIAGNPNSFGAFRQRNGLFKSSAKGGLTYIGCGGNALFVQTGGTNVVGESFSHQWLRAYIGFTNGIASATISGAGTEFRTAALCMGSASDTPTTNILNLADGGKLKVNRLCRDSSAAENSLSVINANGGILAPTYAWNIRVMQGVPSPADPDHFVVWENGLVVDTSENSLYSGEGESVLPFPFETPSGKGVESIALPDISGKVYIGIGRIVIEDASGWGASAYAEFDFDTKALTHVVVTSRGCNYSDGAKAYLEAPDGKSRMECAMTLSDNAGRGGMIVKRGAPRLELSASPNTFAGGYAVEEGELKPWQVPSAAVPVRVESGAILNLAYHSLNVSAFEGAGVVSNGNVTVSTIRAKCADLFNGRFAKFTGNVTLAANAVFEITDAENLSNYRNSNSVVALVSGGTISGAPSLRLTNSDGTPYAGGGRGSLRLADDCKSLRFGSVWAGLLFIVW